MNHLRHLLGKNQNHSNFKYVLICVIIIIIISNAISLVFVNVGQIKKNLFEGIKLYVSGCVRVICRVTRGGMSHEVIYLCAVSVNIQLNGLWAATLTEYGPVCKGECTESDLCSARC